MTLPGAHAATRAAEALAAEAQALKEANRDYGHGLGAETLTKEQAVTLTAFTDAVLDAYFAEGETGGGSHPSGAR